MLQLSCRPCAGNCNIQALSFRLSQPQRFHYALWHYAYQCMLVRLCSVTLWWFFLQVLLWAYAQLQVIHGMVLVSGIISGSSVGLQPHTFVHARLSPQAYGIWWRRTGDTQRCCSQNRVYSPACCAGAPAVCLRSWPSRKTIKFVTGCLRSWP